MFSRWIKPRHRAVLLQSIKLSKLVSTVDAVLKLVEINTMANKDQREKEPKGLMVLNQIGSQVRNCTYEVDLIMTIWISSPNSHLSIMWLKLDAIVPEILQSLGTTVPFNNRPQAKDIFIW